MFATRVAVFALITCLAPLASAQDKPTLTPADYDQWESLGGITLSPDGKWMTTSVRTVGGDSTMTLQEVGKDEGTAIPFGSRATFSPDSAWVAYTKGMSSDERDKLRKANKPAKDQMVLHDLESGETTETEGPTSFGFSPDSKFLAMRFPAASSGASSSTPSTGRPQQFGMGRFGRGGGGGGSGPAADLVVRDLATGIDTNFGNITQYAWLDPGHLLAMVVSSSGKAGNGIRLYDPAKGNLTTLHSSAATYSGLSWRKDHDDLLAVMATSDEEREGDTHTILAWRGLADGVNEKDAFVFDPATAEGFPENTRLDRGVRWSKSGDSFLGSVSKWEKKDEKDEKGKEEAGSSSGGDNGKSNVEVWHSKDQRLFPQQKNGFGPPTEDRPESVVIDVDSGDLTRVANDDFERVQLLPGETAAMGIDDTPYEFDAMFGRGRQDVYLVDAASGERKDVCEGVIRAPSASPTGRYLLYMKEHAYYIHDVMSGETRCLTGDLLVSFVNLENDHPVPEQPGYGVAGWLADDEAVLVYDKYDLWRLESDGSGATRLTDGREQELIMRLARLPRDEDHLDLDEPMYLTLGNPVTKQSGFGILDGDEVTVAVLMDKAVSGLTKAKEADVYAYTIAAFDDSPDYFVGGPDLKDAEQVTKTNSQQDDFAWGRSEIVQFTNKRGLQLQGALYYPAGYEEGQQYPMVVYMYEKVSQGVHRYTTPSETSPYNTTVFTQHGYFVLLPDIVFVPRKPGPSVVDCVESAVGKVISMGMVDPARIGCIGHSWGGYDSSFLATHSDVFATAIAGAPVTNLLTMWGTISGSGSPETGHNEVGQERMEVPWWVDIEAYRKSSAVYGIESMDKPMLMMFGGSDTNVNPLLGYEFYNAARRLGKEMVLLVYPGENHSLRQKPNQIDYQQRILEWYGHYLKGEEAPKWITEGVKFENIEEERERLRKLADQRRKKKDEEKDGDEDGDKDGAAEDSGVGDPEDEDRTRRFLP